MAEVVNLRQFRKQKLRADTERTADANRALFGRTKAEKARERAEKSSAERLLDGHRRERDPTK